MKSTLPKILQPYVKLLRPGQSSAGLTMIEGLVAAVAATLVIGATAMSVMKLMAVERNTSVEVEARMETDRTLTFIASETEQAKKLKNAKVALEEWNTKYNSGSGTFLNGKQAVLALEVQGVDHPIIYYAMDSNSPWKGPKVIKRLGPEILADGSYKPAGSGNGSVDSPDTWASEAIIDGVAANAAIPNNCPYEDANNNKILDSGEDSNGNGVLDTRAPYDSLNPTDLYPFYACVRHDKKNVGTAAQLFLFRELDQAYEQTGVYQASTTIMAKASPDVPTGSSTGLVSTGGPPPTLAAYSPPSTCPSEPIDLTGVGDYGTFAMRTSFEINSPSLNIDSDLAIAPGVEITVSETSAGTIATFRTSDSTQIPEVTNQFPGANPQYTAISLLQAKVDVIRDAFAKANNFSPTQTFGTIDSNQTISTSTLVNVIDIEEINLDGNETLTISGATDDWFIINVKKDLKLSNGAQIGVGGVSAYNIMITVGGTIDVSGGSEVRGSLVAPYSIAKIVDSRVYGGLFAGQVDMSGEGSSSVQEYAFGSGVANLPCP